MTISLRNSACCSVAAVLALCSQAAMALGLGNATVESYLNQPLQVRIDLITRPEEDLSQVMAKLASADDFALIGASREAISVPLRFSIQRDEQGAAVLVTSNLPVKEPIVRLILEVNWPSGRMLREYTLFLDPPTVGAAAPPPLLDQRSDRPSGQAPGPESTTAPGAPVLTEAASPKEPPDSAAAVPQEGEYGPVQSGETLWRIASDWSHGSGFDVNQAMLAIQRNNPHAFINGNINLLMRGTILRMPGVEDLTAWSPEAARAEAGEQHAAFEQDAVSRELASAAATPLVDEASTPSDFAATEAAAEPDAQLEIVPPAESAGTDSAYGTADADQGAEASTSTTGLREELARAEEALIGEQQESQYLRDRITELESQLADAELGTVTDPDLAGMEDRLREERLAAGETAEPEAEGGVTETEAASTAPARPVPQVQSKPPASTETPWYRGVTAWLILALALAAAIAGWFMSRRQPAGVLLPTLDRSKDETVRGIKDEAEEILKVLEPEGAAEEEPLAAAESPLDSEAGAAGWRRSRPAVGRGPDEAEVLDEESEDPEVQLDLARAYMAMGDREAARVILDEVIQQGNETQQAEARSMLGEL